MPAPHRRDTLASDFRALGVEPGDLIFMHSSFKSLGPVEGGAASVVGALEDAVGPDGLILMPSFNLVKNEDRAETWDHATTPSTVGWITEFFRRMPGTHRSDHYSHSVAARGRGAEEFVSCHLNDEGLDSPWDRPPWGKTYGTHSPMRRAYDADGKLLMLGVDYKSSTYVHLVEVMYWHVRRESDPQADYSWIRREAVGEFWDALGRMRHGKVGDAECRLFRIRDYVDTVLTEVEHNPGPYVKTW